MLDKLVALVEGKLKHGSDEAPHFERAHVAVAALMVESSHLDTDFEVSERDAIFRIVEERFGLDPDKAGELIDVAAKREEQAANIWQFTEAIRKSFGRHEHLEIMALLWEVAYADGSLHRFERDHIARVAKELDVDEVELEDARKLALRRLGMND